jgi:hypothetical protein
MNDIDSFYNILSDIIKILIGDEKCKDCENVNFILNRYNDFFEYMKNINFKQFNEIEKKSQLNIIYDKIDKLSSEFHKYYGWYYCCDRCGFRCLSLMFGFSEINRLKQNIPDLFIIDI